MFIFEKVETVPFWKKIYQTATGYSPSVTYDIVNEILNATNKELKAGYSVYERYSEEEFQTWKRSITEKDEELKSFVKRLCKTLNLKPKIAIPIFFNYLMFEYYGKIGDIKNLILYEHSMLSLLENVWQFYSSERMYYVKTLRHIFENAVKPESQFRNEYMVFIGKIDIPEFRKVLISQLKQLINEITEKSLENSFDKKNYVNRNNREQLEFILLIIMTMEYKEISVDEFLELFENFLIHNFTRQPVYFDTTLYGDFNNFNDVKTAEIGCFIILLCQLGEKIKTLPKNIEISLRNIQNQGNHKIVLFAWVLGKLKTCGESELEIISSYENLLRILIEGQIFSLVAEFLSTKLMKADIRATTLIQAGVFKLLDDFLIAIDSEVILLQNTGLIQAVACLMEDTEIAGECVTARGGLDAIVKIVFEQYQENFTHLTIFCKVLVKHPGLATSVISKLSNLRTNAATSYGKFDASLLKDGSENYFTYLAKITMKLCEAPNNLNDTILQEILIGFELIHQIVKYYKDDVNKCGFNECLSLLGQFVNMNSTIQKFAQFVKIYFKIHTSMVLHQNSTVACEFQALQMSMPFLPKLQTLETIPEVLMQRHTIDSTLLQILRKEEYENKHSTIRTYLKLVLHCIMSNSNLEIIQIPGVIYTMIFVFPHHRNWQYKDFDEQIEISVLCLKIMFEVLNQKSENEKRNILKNFLFYALLKNSSMMNIFLQYLIQEKYYLQKLMLNEVDWLNGNTLECITLSKLHLSIFLHLLNDCNLKPSDEFLKPKIQTVTKCAASFITNAFSSSLANLACRLLEKLSQDSNIPILAVLEMDYSQIQCLFLEKLRDPLEDDIFKITALDFINTSLLSQNGLTAAFFNAPGILDTKEKDQNMPVDSVSDFMIDYLENIQKSPDYLTNPVQKSILRVFSTLWSTGRENLVKDIYSLRSFWPLLTDPLFHPRIKDPDVYTHIMTITTIHILQFQQNVDQNLKQVVTDFFKDEKLIDEWIYYIKSVLNTYISNYQNKKVIKFIFAWKKFLISIKTYIPEVINSNSIKCKLILSCLKGMLWHFSVLSSNEIITDFSDLYLILTFTWYDSYKTEIETIELLTTVLSSYVTNCKFPSTHNREVFLTMVHNTIKDCRSLLQNNPYLLNNLLKSFGLMFDSEYNYLCNFHDNSNAKLKSVMCWVLVAQVGDTVLSLNSVKPFSVFFKYHQYLAKMLESIRPLVADSLTLPLVKMILKTLIHYAESDIASDFLTENYSVVYDIIDNGKPLFLSSNKEEFPVILKEQWILYSMVMKLNHVLVNKFGEKMMETNLTFLSVYDRILSQMICLPEYTVDSRALDLSCETLQYISKILQWSDIWYIKNMDSFSLIVMSIKRVLNTCISTVLRPENVHFFRINKLGKLTFVVEPVHNLITNVVNKFLELSCLALKCLLKCNPSMIQLLSMEKPKSTSYLLIEYDFTVPKFDIPITGDLTYGRLLCMIYFLCKTLNQEFSKDRETKSIRICKIDAFAAEIGKEKSLGEIFGKFTLFDNDYIGFIEYPKSTNHVLQPIKLSAFLHYGEQVNSEPWIRDISKEKVQITLEFLMSFLAVQVFFQVHMLQKPQLHYFKRELYSELQFFNEYTKKLATDEYNNQLLKKRSESQKTDPVNKLVSEILSRKMDVAYISDKFYLLAISKWFMNICQLS
ncbi:hypothetical protein WA026_012770 [Henosepilachna vigintioctopunctata]|uniref:Uncharacterized protein n=1 Tax=Henosepilachna vigintioctopunctata TaxID=420089 RepID=A0AAW1U758_9CUCU